MQASISPLQQPDGFELAFRLRQPPSGQARRCVILLHGVGGNESSLIPFADHIDAETLLVWVRAPLSLGAGQFAWFQVHFSATGPSINPQQAEASRLVLIAFIQKIQQTYGIQAEHTVVAGFSQGGILSASVALTAPHSVAGFGLLSGRIQPELAPQIADPTSLAGLKGFISHGEADSKLPLSWALRADTQLNQLGVEHVLQRYPAEHEITPAMLADFLSWLDSVA